MPIFDYKGRTLEGKLITGKRLSSSQDTLGAQLFKEGVTPIAIVEVKQKKDYLQFVKQLILGRVVSVDELGLFARQMHTLLKTGVPITTALRQLGDNARTPQMANALYSIVDKLASGQDLVSAMKEYPKIFTPIMVSMVRVGMDSGRLDEAFLRLNQYLELEAMGIKKVKSALRYPSLIFLTVICAIFFVVILVIPTFSKVFAQANIPLPFLTRALVSLSDFVASYWYLLLTLLIFIIGMFVYYLRTPKGQLIKTRIEIKIPVFGEIIRRIVMLRFTQAFALTIESGIPLLEGLSLVATTINNKYAEEELLHMSESIRHGKTLTQSAASSPLFTPLELQMLSVSEETGQLTLMLEEMSNFYRREVDYDLKKLNDIIEPVMIIILAVIVLLLAFAVYLPIWNMVQLAR